MVHIDANEVDLLTALHKKLIKWKFQVQGEDLNKTHLYIICQVYELCVTAWKIHYNL